MGVMVIGAAAQSVESSLSYRVLCYHDVQEDVRVNPDRYAVGSARLVTQFAWMKHNGYRVVSLDDVIAAREGRRALPAKAVVLTFDDGYRSVYTRVFPLLKLFNYPAIVAPPAAGWMRLQVRASTTTANRCRASASCRGSRSGKWPIRVWSNLPRTATTCTGAFPPIRRAAWFRG
jgi:hypothetical protein